MEQFYKKYTLKSKTLYITYTKINCDDELSSS